jgi:4-amino-4-deoxy-L-arabinose transferase-like glycosyltransferase
MGAVVSRQWSNYHHTMADAASVISRRGGAYDAAIVVAVALAGNAVIALAILATNAHYLRDYRTNANPDAVHYVLLGHNIWRHGEFSRNDHAPYTPDMLRTPVYPLVAGALELIARAPWPIYALQAICHAATAVVVLRFARQMWGRRAGLIAGLLVAADGVLAVANFEAMSESLYVLLATLGTLAWLACLDNREIKWRSALFAGAMLGAATLTRPAGIYLPLALLLATIIVSLAARRWKLLGYGLAAATIYAACVSPWIVRNYLVFGLPRIAHTDTLTMLYFSGAGAYAEDRGLTREAAQAEIAMIYDVEPVHIAHNPWQTNRPLAEMDAHQRRIYRMLVKDHPRGLIVSSLQGLAKSLAGHDVNVLAHATGREWYGSGAGGLLRGNFAGFAERIKKNGALLTLAFVYQVALTLVVLVLAGAGWIVMLVRRKQAALWLGISAACGYYVVTILIVGVDAYARHRLGMTPLLAMLAAYAIATIRRARSSPTSPPGNAG